MTFLDSRPFGVLVCLAAMAMFWFSRRRGLKTGAMPMKVGLVYREKNPKIFRLTVTMYTVFIVVFGILAVAMSVGLLPL
jgi:hypothetical protein